MIPASESLGAVTTDCGNATNKQREVPRRRKPRPREPRTPYVAKSTDEEFLSADVAGAITEQIIVGELQAIAFAGGLRRTATRSALVDGGARRIAPQRISRRHEGTRYLFFFRPFSVLF